MAGPYASSDERNYFAVGLQSVKGTGVAPTVFLPYKGSLAFDHGADGEAVMEAGTGPYVARLMKTKHDPSGSGACAWRPKTIAQLMAFFLGADTSTLNGSLYDHAAKYAATMRWLTAERCVSDEIIERIVDSVIKKVTIEHEGNADLMFGFECFGLTPGWQASATSETYETGVSGSTPGGPYRGEEATHTIDGSAATDVRKWKLELELKYDEDLRLSKVTRGHTLKLALTGKLTLEQLALATDDYRKVNYGSTSGTAANKNFFGTGAFNAVYDNGLATTNQRVATIDCPNIDWKTAKVTDQNPDGETVWLTREGDLKKVAGAELITVTSKTADAVAYV